MSLFIQTDWFWYKRYIQEYLYARNKVEFVGNLVAIKDIVDGLHLFTLNWIMFNYLHWHQKFIKKLIKPFFSIWFFIAAMSPYPELRHRVTHPRPYIHSKHHHEHHLGPFFEEPLNATTGALHVGVHLATEAVLNCRVGMLKDKTV